MSKEGLLSAPKPSFEGGSPLKRRKVANGELFETNVAQRNYKIGSTQRRASRGERDTPAESIEREELPLDWSLKIHSEFHASANLDWISMVGRQRTTLEDSPKSLTDLHVALKYFCYPDRDSTAAEERARFRVLPDAERGRSVEEWKDAADSLARFCFEGHVSYFYWKGSDNVALFQTPKVAPDFRVMIAVSTPGLRAALQSAGIEWVAPFYEGDIGKVRGVETGLLIEGKRNVLKTFQQFCGLVSKESASLPWLISPHSFLHSKTMLPRMERVKTTRKSDTNADVVMWKCTVDGVLLPTLIPLLAEQLTKSGDISDGKYVTWKYTQFFNLDTPDQELNGKFITHWKCSYDSSSPKFTITLGKGTK